MAAPLEGIRVLDFSQTRPAAVASQFLADFGAEVVHVEPPGGSPLRHAAAYPYLARGKRSLVLDLADEGDRATAGELAAAADVLIEAFRPGVAERIGLDPAALRAANPRLVTVSISGFGADGPLRNLKGYEGLVMAKLGVFHRFEDITPRPGPAYLSIPFCSIGAAHGAIQGTLTALYEREHSGLGQHVATSLLQGFLNLDVWAWFHQVAADLYPEAYPRTSRFSENGVPQSLIALRLIAAPTKDGFWLQFAQTAPRLFEAFLTELDLEELLPELADLSASLSEERRRECWERMLAAVRERTLAEWRELFRANPNVFAEEFRRGSEVLEHPQLQHGGWIAEVDDPEFGRSLQLAPPIQLRNTPGLTPQPAPRIDDAAGAVDEWSAQTPAATNGDGAARQAPLAGITVLDLGSQFAGPYGTTQLADLGARVIKVEPLGGDQIRVMHPCPEIAGVNAMQGKESIAIDVKTDEGREIVSELTRRCDLVFQGFRPGAAERLGLDAATVRAANPDVVYLNAPAYGLDGPYAAYPAYAPSIGAAGGFGDTNTGGYIPRDPAMPLDEVKQAVIQLTSATTKDNANADSCAALVVADALLLGLLARARGMGGQDVLTTMLSSAAYANYEDAVGGAGQSTEHRPDPQLYGLSARYCLYEAADGWIFLAAPQTDEWEPLTAALADHADLVGDARFSTEALRRENDEALAEVLAAVFRTRPGEEWERELTAADIGCVVAADQPPEVVIMRAEFAREAGYVTDVTHPMFGEHPRATAPMRFSRSTTVSRPGCLLGEQTDPVLDELGYSSEQIADLRARGVIR